MRTYRVEGENDSPSVYMDESRSLIEFAGNSTLKDTNAFYSNILRWIIAFNSGNSQTRIVNIRLQKINDSTLTWLETIIRKLLNFTPADEFEVNWYITDENKRTFQKALLLQTQSGKKVNLI